MSGEDEELEIPSLTIQQVADGLAAALESGASREDMERLVGLVHDEDAWVRLEAELALAFINVVPRCFACHTQHNEELPHLVVRAARGDEVALSFVKMTAESAADTSAHNLAKTALHYIAVLERWRGGL